MMNSKFSIIIRESRSKLEHKKYCPKMVMTFKVWHEILPFALHGYLNLVYTSNGATPFSLLYGREFYLGFHANMFLLHRDTSLKVPT